MVINNNSDDRPILIGLADDEMNMIFLARLDIFLA